ncbi:hypothetical protein GCM10010211_79390 [Streptomyces albospinus]|uniref:HEAT repeat domain-containing protein n=1 Tax=Streptomyces albospinus TaxID=285515 RepID=A0ABQ2VNF2_9ACTN|nr:hypothetical protein [Streptomyces albospinus]GGV00128.1 hypothetical protein GCM10010211_79390 [Streptomyces albospinus]
MALLDTGRDTDVDADAEAAPVQGAGACRGGAYGEAYGGRWVGQHEAELGQLAWAATEPGVDRGGRAARRLTHELLRVADAAPYGGVLRLLADRVTQRSLQAGGFGYTGLDEFGPPFWRCLALGDAARLDLLRRLLPADGPGAAPAPGGPVRPFARPPRVRVHPADDAAAGQESGGWVDACPGTPYAASAEAFRRAGGTARPARTGPAGRSARFLDAVADLLKADPERIQPLLCGWFDDTRRLQVAPAVPREITVAGAAQALLHTYRARALDPLVEVLAATAHPRAAELLDALAEDEPAALCRAVGIRAREERPGGRSAGTAALLRALAAVTRPDLAARAAGLVREYAGRCPDRAARPVAEFVARRLDQGPAAHEALGPLVVELLNGSPAPVRRALAPVLAGAGPYAADALRWALLDVLLAREASDAPPAGGRGRGYDTSVLEALLGAAAEGTARRPEERTRELVHRAGMLLARTPEGAACFDRRLVELGRRVPGFARRVAEWLAAEPGEWASVVGPGACATLAGCRG